MFFIVSYFSIQKLHYKVHLKKYIETFVGNIGLTLSFHEVNGFPLATKAAMKDSHWNRVFNNLEFII